MKTTFILISCILILIFTEVSFAYHGPYQGNWRWRNDDGNVYSATWKNSLNHPYIITNYDNIRLRISYYRPLSYSSNISLRYSEKPGIVPWIPVTNIDTGKFFISSSKYLTDMMSYFDSQLLPGDSDYSYVKAVTIDSTNNYLLLTDDSSMYELEYSIKPTSKIQPGSVYFFSLFEDTIPIQLYNGSEYAVLQTSPVSWSTQYSGTTEALEDICFVDLNNGWAVGFKGKILKTTNGGLSWTPQVSGTSMDLYAVSFVDKDNGWIVGSDYSQDIGIICKTTDGGKSWSSQSTHYEISDVTFKNVKIGWIVSNNKIYKTADGGETWSLQSSGIDYDLTNIYFTDLNNGIAVGGGGYQWGDWGDILRTTNGGDTWTSHQINENESHFLRGVFFIDTNNGWAVGGKYLSVTTSSGIMPYEASTILKTTDGGEIWLNQPSGTNHALFGVYFTDANNGLVVGASGTILRTTNGGENWTLQTSGTSVSLSAVSFADANNVIVVGSNGKILRSTNGSATSVSDDQGNKEPSHFLLSQNYPNPFNPTTTIKYSIPKQSLVTLKIYDVLGREITTLVNEEKNAGTYKINFNASSLASGVYFYRLQAGNFVATKKMILLK